MNKKFNDIEFKSFCCNTPLIWTFENDLIQHNCHCYGGDFTQHYCYINTVLKYQLIIVKNIIINNININIIYNIVDNKIRIINGNEYEALETILEINFEEKLLIKENVLKTIKTLLLLK